jgi:hypothetical protein
MPALIASALALFLAAYPGRSCSEKTYVLLTWGSVMYRLYSFGTLWCWGILSFRSN